MIGRFRPFSVRTRNRLALGLLILLLGGVLTLIDQRGNLMSPPPVPESSEGEPDYYLEGVEYTRFDTQGRPAQTMQSPRLTHTPNDDITRARTPHFTLLDDQQRRWQADGQQARLGPDGNTFQLAGNAVLHQPDEGWRLETDVLHYNLDQRRAWSDSESTFIDNRQRTRGDRFEALLDEDRLHIEGNVHGYYPGTTP
ncbi:LPS export ABC transporter periplasmic protein LptC [Kushneria aurantia]|uniref:LPS export ABC transporter periplasmic protein LptC n=1 Tax=Kushneria aurantia TaxID=504092 RepID=A0ABV6FZZ8_9GAMM|nr:LPS export ABC transporter periplasmic protein LptC [Kushneria aurantia]